MTSPDLRKKVLAHLSDPLSPLSEKQLGEAAKWVTYPTKNPTDKGGLSALGKLTFSNDPEVLEKSAAHKENTRTKLHAVIAICSAFVKANSSKSTLAEKTHAKGLLANGIAFIDPNGKTDQIQTSRKNGTILTDRFKKMMSEAMSGVKTDSPNLAKVILSAASVQKSQEMKEAKKREGIAEMA